MAKLLKKANNLFLLLTVMVVGICFFSCKKVPAPLSTSASFIKTYQNDSSVEATYIEQMQDGGFLIISCEGAGRPVITKTDKSGNQRWVKTVQKNWYNLYSGNSGHCFITKISDNLYNLQAGFYITNIDTLGNIINAALPNPYHFNGPILKIGSNYIAPWTDGWQQSGSTDNDILKFDNTLTYQGKDTFLDTKVGGRILQFFVYGLTSTGDYNIWGQKFTKQNWSFSDNYKIFIARISKTGKAIQTIIDGNKLNVADQPEYQLSGPDSTEILLASREEYYTQVIYPIIIKVDKNLDTIWKKEYPSSAGSLILNCMTKCNDGGFMVTGKIQDFGVNNEHPYALKIDKDGKEQWHKIISSKGTGQFLYGISTSDGGYALVGFTNDFGGQLNGNRILFVKTDANGN